MKWKIKKKKWVNDFHSKTDTSLVSIALPLRRANFSKRENLKSVLLMGVSVSAFVCLFVCFFARTKIVSIYRGILGQRTFYLTPSESYE